MAKNNTESTVDKKDLNGESSKDKLNSGLIFEGEFIFNAVHSSKPAREIKAAGKGSNEAEALSQAAAEAAKQLKGDEHLSYTCKFKKLNRE